MSRYEKRISELTELGYKPEQAKEIARAEEAERQTNALVRIADALMKQNAGKHGIESLSARLIIDKENVLKRIAEGFSIDEAIKGNVKVIEIV